MYGQGGGVTLGATTTAAGVAVLPSTGGNTFLTIVGVTAVVLGSTATLLQLAVMGYRRHILRSL